jgi:biopolymer transport protein ExbD
MKIDLEEEEGFEVQMAPLIDCVFLLLIFFLVATTLRVIDRELPLDLPDSAAALEVQQPEDLLVVSIDRELNLYVNGNARTITMLQADLREWGEAQPYSKTRLDIDRQVPFQRVMEVLDILRFEGFQNVSIQSRHEREYGRR